MIVIVADYGILELVRSKLPKVLPEALKSAADNCAEELRSRFARTVKTWVTPPVFTTSITHSGLSTTVTVGTDNPIYAYLEYGTAVRQIVPVRAPVLVFRPGYIPATRHGVLDAQTPHAFGNLVFRKIVWKHSIAKRDFTSTIIQDALGPITEHLTNAIVSEFRRV